MTLVRIRHLIFILAYIVIAKLTVSSVENSAHIMLSGQFKFILLAVIYILFGCIIGFQRSRRMRFSWSRFWPFLILFILFWFLFLPYIGVSPFWFGFHKTVYIFVFSQNLGAWHLLCIALGYYLISIFADQR